MARRVSSARPILCAVLDGAALGATPGARAEALFVAGVDWIQLRDRSLEAGPLLSLARALTAARDRVDAAATARALRSDGSADAAGGARAASSPSAPLARHRVVVNKRLDVAVAAGADGIHLGLDALAAPDAATALRLALGDGHAHGGDGGDGGVDDDDRGDRPVLGASIHSLAELEALIAADLPLHTVQLAPIWSPRSKPAERPALGLELLARAAALARATDRLVIAQGGLDVARAAEAVAAGAAGIAVTGVLTQASDPAGAARALRDALDRAAATAAASARTVGAGEAEPGGPGPARAGNTRHA